jgi:hypothetical protein
MYIEKLGHRSNKKSAWLRAQFDATISPINHVQSTVNQLSLCDVVRCCAMLLERVHDNVSAIVEAGTNAVRQRAAAE